MKIIPSNKAKSKKRLGRARKGEGSLKVRGGVYYYVIPDPARPGKRIERCCGTSDVSEAVKIKAQALAQSQSPEQSREDKPAAIASKPEPPKPKSKVTVGEILDSYASWAKYNRRRSFRAMNCAIQRMKQSLGALGIDELTTMHGEEYRLERTEDDEVQDSTVNHEFTFLRAAFRQAQQETPPRVTTIPFIRNVKDADNVRQGFIEYDDYQKILPFLAPELRALFVAAFHTGARRGELLMIKWASVNFKDGLIELPATTTKTAKGRWIPIWGDMREYLEIQKEVRDRLFPQCPFVFFQYPDAGHMLPGSPLSYFRTSWKRSVEEAGYPDLLFHDLRRSALRYANQDARIDQTLCMRMSGHLTVSTFVRYNIAGATDMVKMGKLLDAHRKEANRKGTTQRKKHVA